MEIAKGDAVEVEGDEIDGWLQARHCPPAPTLFPAISMPLTATIQCLHEWRILTAGDTAQRWQPRAGARMGGADDMMRPSGRDGCVQQKRSNCVVQRALWDELHTWRRNCMNNGSLKRRLQRSAHASWCCRLSVDAAPLLLPLFWAIGSHPEPEAQSEALDTHWV